MRHVVDLFAVQPFMRLEDYATEAAFSEKVAGLMDRVARERTTDRPALVVFPEDFATFLAVQDAVAALKPCRSFHDALSQLGRHYAGALLAAMWRGPTLSVSRAFLLAMAPKIWRTWHGTFSKMAQHHRATIVAGSALLPDNRLGWNTPEFAPQGTRLYNLSVTFDATGRVVHTTRKVNLVPTQEDRLPLSPGPREAALATFQVGGVLAATAICYDAFRVAHTAGEPEFYPLLAPLDARGVEVIAQPSANPWPWNAPWALDPARRRADEWREDGAEASLQGCRSISVVINPLLLLDLWDLHFDGQSRIFRRVAGRVATVAESPAGDARPASETVIHYAWDSEGEAYAPGLSPATP